MSDIAQEPPEAAAETREQPAAPAAKRRAFSMAWLAILAYVAFDVGLPLIPIRLHGLHLSHFARLAIALGLLVAPTSVFMLLQLWVAQSVVALQWRLALAWLGAAASVVLWFAVLVFVHPVRGMSANEFQDILLFKSTGLGLFLTLALAFLGILLSRIVREPNVLLPVALIAMPIDYVGAMTSVGFTHAVEQHAPTVVSNVSVPVPTIGGMHSALGVHPLAFIGPGDGLFIAFFFAAVQTMGLNRRGTFWWMYALLTIAMLIVLIWGFPIAALVPMGLAVIIANVRFFHFKRSEVFAMGYAIVFVLIIVGAFYMTSHHWFYGSLEPHHR